MKKNLTFSLGLLLSVSSSALASTHNNNQANINQIQQQVTKMEAQFDAEKKAHNKEIAALKAQMARLQKQNNQKHNRPSLTAAGTTFTADPNIYEPRGIFRFAPLVVGSPYVQGHEVAYDASDLMINWSAVNEDLSLLKQNQQDRAELKARGLPPADRPIIELSGYVEGGAYWQEDYENPTKSDINLTAAKIMVASEVSSWASAEAVLAYDSTMINDAPRFSNSRIFIERAFATIGNFDEAPVYGTLGQFYVPFGSYSNVQIVDPLTKTLARTLARAFKLGFYKNNLYAGIYAFKGETSIVGDNPLINNGGINLGYKYIGQNFTVEVGTSYIMNLADSKGMLIVSSPNQATFSGFGSSGSSTLQHQVPAGDLRATFAYGNLSLITEYVTALRGFDRADMMFNNHGATVGALFIHPIYNFHIFNNRPAFISGGYQQSWEALALHLPQNSYVATLGISLWKSTSEKLEYRHDINYQFSDIASGGGLPGIITPSTHDFRERNVVTASIDVYF